MKLTIEKLAPYLPYGLNIMMESIVDSKEPNIESLTGIQYDGLALLGEGGRFGFYQRGFKDIKPILRPLSDLTKDEYSFIYEYEMGYDSLEDFLKLDNESMLKNKFSYEFLTELFHYHFDFFGLIPEGLAIDINTLS